MTFNDLEGQFAENLSILHSLRNTACIISDAFAHELESANKGLLKVTVRHVHCKCANLLETVPDRVVVSTDNEWGQFR